MCFCIHSNLFDCANHNVSGLQIIHKEVKIQFLLSKDKLPPKSFLSSTVMDHAMHEAGDIFYVHPYIIYTSLLQNT